MYTFGSFNRAQIGPPRLPQLGDGFEGVCKIEKTYVNETRFGHKFFCEMTVMSSNLHQNPVGQRVIFKQDLTKRDVADNALLTWGAGILGVAREDGPRVAQLQAAMDGLINYAVYYQDNNNFTQKYVLVKARHITTGNNRPFVAHDWFPYVPSNGG